MHWLRFLEAPWVFCLPGMYTRTEGDIGTSSFPYRACVVP
jgi:hypothetical protein